MPDSGFPKLFTRLRVAVRDAFNDAATGADADVYEAHLLASALAWLAPLPADRGLRLTDDVVHGGGVAPAVVNSTRLALSSAEVPYLQLPYSVLRAAVPYRDTTCVKRAYITVEGAVTNYLAWYGAACGRRTPGRRRGDG